MYRGDRENRANYLGFVLNTERPGGELRHKAGVEVQIGRKIEKYIINKIESIVIII